MVLLAAAGLAACSSDAGIHQLTPDRIVSEGRRVRACQDGTRIYEYKGVYAYYTPGGAFFDSGYEVGFLPPDVKPEGFCQ
jgi:hypothetical protein